MGPGQQGGMRGQGQGRLRNTVVKFHTPGGKQVHGRGLDAREPVTSHPVRPQGIHCDQNEIQIAFSPEAGEIIPALLQQNKDDQKDKNDHGCNYKKYCFFLHDMFFSSFPIWIPIFMGMTIGK
jgi:hypothetical protein